MKHSAPAGRLIWLGSSYRHFASTRRGTSSPGVNDLIKTPPKSNLSSELAADSFNVRQFVAKTLHQILEELVERNLPFSVFLDERQGVPLVGFVILDLERGRIAIYFLVARLRHFLILVFLIEALQQFIGRLVLFLRQFVEHVQ